MTLFTVFMQTDVFGQVSPCDTTIVNHQQLFTCDSSAVYLGNSYTLGSHILNMQDSLTGCNVDLVLQVMHDPNCYPVVPCDSISTTYNETIYTCDSIVLYKNRYYGLGNHTVNIIAEYGVCDSTVYLYVLRDTACVNCAQNIIVNESIYTCDLAALYLNNYYTLGNHAVNVPALSGGCDTTIYLSVLRDSTCITVCDSTLSNLIYTIQQDSAATSVGLISVMPQANNIYRLSNPIWGTTGLSTNPHYTNLPVGIYVLTAIDTLTGCTGYISLEITDFIAPLRTQVQFPDAFTPNFDGENDFFRPIVESTNIAVQSFEIYDNSGRLIYQSNLIDNGWDGTYRGEEMPRGVFMAVFKYALPSGEVKVERTSFMLMR